MEGKSLLHGGPQALEFPFQEGLYDLLLISIPFCCYPPWEGLLPKEGGM